ncbi:chemocyanin-like [Vicia villosa]|uniref:chemocyanin-like n=1 Tax=Vicia villosa TaxID=3911 RepID=UPI00273C7ECA|nr:chemocyanin-like [Vicia villosa]
MRPVWALKVLIVIVFTSILFRGVCGANHTVGGASGWDLNVNMHDWSSTTTFNVGDDLVFSYTPLHDVVEVNQQGYDTCTIANAIGTYNTGETVIHLTSEGTRYFVCGRMGHCQMGLKLEVRIPIQSNNNGTGDNQNQPGGARRNPPPPRSPLRFPPPHHQSPPSPRDAPSDAPTEEPCDCSSAGEGRWVVSLITRVTVLGLIFFSSLFFVN